MSLDRKINRIQFLSGNSLKVIAVLTMLIDHLCKIVLQWLLLPDGLQPLEKLKTYI